MNDDEWLKVIAGEVDWSGAPTLPPERVQLTTVGRSGRRIIEDAFSFKAFLKEMLAKYAEPPSRGTRVLDFGCGWGRTLRTFLNDIDPKNLHGVDAQDWLIKIAEETTMNGVAFRKVDQTPPTGLPSSDYDLIYAYSVFSHLSERTANAWIQEFNRLLRPGGLLCLTTRPRAHIEVWRKDHEQTIHSDSYSQMFADADADLARYDRGEFVFHPGPNHELKAEHYGEAVIPEKYVLKHWVSEELECLGFFEGYSKTYLQPAIVLRKRGRV